MRMLLLLLVASRTLAQGCAATPEAAAHAAIGISAAAATGTGYRVADAQADPVMKRVWLRVVRCDDAAAPAVLVPLSALLRSEVAPAETSLQPVVIHAGDPVQAHLSTSSMRMTMDTVADGSGAVGDVITLRLKRRAGQLPDEPQHRIRGIVRADKSVEVLP